jgi:hypothetical protein
MLRPHYSLYFLSYLPVELHNNSATDLFVSIVTLFGMILSESEMGEKWMTGINRDGTVVYTPPLPTFECN